MYFFSSWIYEKEIHSMTNFPNSFLLNLWAVEVKGNIILFFDMCNISLLSPSVHVYFSRLIFPKAQAGTKLLYTQRWKLLFTKVEQTLNRQEHTQGKEHENLCQRMVLGVYNCFFWLWPLVPLKRRIVWSEDQGLSTVTKKY